MTDKMTDAEIALHIKQTEADGIRTNDIYEIHREMDDPWSFAEAIVDMIDRKVKEQTQ